MFNFWQENRAMRARISELEDALTSARADLAKEKMLYDKTFKEFDDAVSDREKQRQQLQAHKEEFSDYDETVTRLSAENEQQKKLLVNLRSENAALAKKVIENTATQDINDQLRADRDQWRERANLRTEPTAQVKMLREELSRQSEARRDLDGHCENLQKELEKATNRLNDLAGSKLKLRDQNDRLIAERDDLKSKLLVAKNAVQVSETSYRDLQKLYGDLDDEKCELSKALAAAKKETAELDERWIGEIVKKDEAIRNVIEKKDEAILNIIKERDDLQATVQSLQHDFNIAHKRNLDMSKSDLDAYMQKQTAGWQPPLLTSIPKPPAEGRWKLGAENGQIDWYNDGPCSPRAKPIGPFMSRGNYEPAPSMRVRAPGEPYDGAIINEKIYMGQQFAYFADTHSISLWDHECSTVSMARCGFVRDARYGGFERCTLQNGHPGDHVYQSDATMSLKPGDPAGSGPRN